MPRTGAAHQPSHVGASLSIGSSISPHVSNTVLKGLRPGNTGGLQSWWSCEDISGIKLGDLEGFMVSPLFGEDNFMGISARQYQAMLPALQAATQVLASEDSLAYLHALCFGPRTVRIEFEGTEDQYAEISFMDSVATDGKLTPQQTLDINMLLAHVAPYLTIALTECAHGYSVERKIDVPIPHLEGHGSDLELAAMYLHQLSDVDAARKQDTNVSGAMEVGVQFQLMSALLTAIPHAIDNAVRFSDCPSAIYYQSEIVSEIGFSYVNLVLGGIPVLATRPKRLGPAQQYCDASKLARGVSITDAVCDLGGAVALSQFDGSTPFNPYLEHGHDWVMRGSPSGCLSFHTRVPMAHVASFFDAWFWNAGMSLKVAAGPLAPQGYTGETGAGLQC